MFSLEHAYLYGIIDLGYVPVGEMREVARLMIAGGIDIIQLRAKEASVSEVEKMAREIVEETRAAGIPFIVNDRPEVAASVWSDGLHVGQDDIPLAEAREIVGEDMIVGKSTHSLAQAQAAVEEGADYIGFGPMFATPTKPDYQPIGYADVLEVHRRVDLPVFCIGGLKIEHLPQLLEAGGRRAVIVSGILQAESISQYVREARAVLAAVSDNPDSK